MLAPDAAPWAAHLGRGPLGSSVGVVAASRGWIAREWPRCHRGTPAHVHPAVLQHSFLLQMILQAEHHSESKCTIAAHLEQLASLDVHAASSALVQVVRGPLHHGQVVLWAAAVA